MNDFRNDPIQDTTTDADVTAPEFGDPPATLPPDADGVTGPSVDVDVNAGDRGTKETVEEQKKAARKRTSKK